MPNSKSHQLNSQTKSSIFPQNEFAFKITYISRIWDMANGQEISMHSILMIYPGEGDKNHQQDISQDPKKKHIVPQRYLI